jgi:hypothetical protein
MIPSWAITALALCAKRLRSSRSRAEEGAATETLLSGDKYPFIAGSMTGACDAAASDIESILKALEAGNG